MHRSPAGSPVHLDTFIPLHLHSARCSPALITKEEAEDLKPEQTPQTHRKQLDCDLRVALAHGGKWSWWGLQNHLGVPELVHGRSLGPNLTQPSMVLLVSSSEYAQVWARPCLLWGGGRQVGGSHYFTAKPSLVLQPSFCPFV